MIKNLKKIITGYLRFLPHIFLFFFAINTFYLLSEKVRFSDPLPFLLYWTSILSAILVVWIKRRKILNLKRIKYIVLLILIIFSVSIFFQYLLAIENTFILYLLNILKFTGVTFLFSFLSTSNSFKITSPKISKNLGLILLIIILLIAFFLRIYKLDFLPPSVDEYFHLIAAKKENLLDFYNYQRGAFVTELIAFLFRIFSENSIFLARFPGVIAGVITSFFVFKIGSKFDKTLGLLAAFLFATCPLCVGMARYIREYEYFMAIFAICFYLILNTQEITNYIRNFKFRKEIIALFLINTLLIIYYLAVDKSGAIVEILGSQIITLIIININQLWSKFLRLSIRNKILITIIILTIFVFISLYFLRNYSWVINTIDINTDYLNMFFDPQWNAGNFIPFWYSQLNFIPQVFIIFLFILPLFTASKQKFLIINYLLFFFTTIPFVIFSDRYFGPRYVYLGILPFVIIISYSILFSIAYVRKVTQKKFIFYGFLVVIVILFSPLNVIRGLITETPEESDPKTRLSHYDKDVMFEFLYKNGYKDGDKVITTREDFFAFWKDEYPFILVEDTDKHPLKRFYYYDKGNTLWYDYIDIGYYTYKNERNGEDSTLATSYAGQDCYDNVCKMNEKQRVTKLMESYSSGWLILDKDRNSIWNSNGFPKKDFFTAYSKVTYIGSTESSKGFDFYFWEPL